MSKKGGLTKYLPLTEATYYIMLMLVEPTHGYGVMQEVEAATGGTITVGPGTLYGAFSTLEEEELIEMVRKEGRRKVYALTEKGKVVLQRQIERLEMMVQHGKQRLAEEADQ
jgi:DNA-binding PadR family transcriptional regulator